MHLGPYCSSTGDIPSIDLTANILWKPFDKEGTMRHPLHLSAFLLLLLRLPAVAQQGCRSVEYKQDQLLHNPGLTATFLEIESFTHRQMERSRVIVNGVDHGGNGTTTITVPVVVHIVYNNPTQNITDAQVQSQIAVLNMDYRKRNRDTSQIPSYYRNLAADCGIRFMLANVDTNGKSTTGIIRRQTQQQGFSYNDAVKFTARGGDDAWDRDRYLNIWVCDLTDGVLGYSSAPGCPKQNDGVTIDYTTFGTTGTAATPFNLGRTATHEIGHWLNLIHIWGDAACGNDDVDDTPQQGTATHGNPSGMIFSCGNTPYGNLYMDYMDFTDDAGMHLFTYGQRERIRSLFAEGGARYPLLTSTGYVGGSETTEDPGPGSDMSIRIYPNPAVGSLWITTSNTSYTGAVLDVYNQVGQKVVTTRISGVNFQLDLSSLSKGIYFLRVNGAGKNDWKLVKM